MDPPARSFDLASPGVAPQLYTKFGNDDLTKNKIKDTVSTLVMQYTLCGTNIRDH